MPHTLQAERHARGCLAEQLFESASGRYTRAPVGSADFEVGLLSPVWAGTRAATLTSDVAVLAAMLDVEIALVHAQAPTTVTERVEKIARSWKLDPAEIAVGARATGNPVLTILSKLREALDEEAAGWLHRGATSQDIIDTALILISRRAVTNLVTDARACCERLMELATLHKKTVIVGRTHTQHAAPSTLGLKIAGWLWAIASATGALHRAANELPVQLGGSVGTLASFQRAGSGRLVEKLAHALGLQVPTMPWHVLRFPITRLGDDLVTMSDALGTAAANVSLLSRPEIGELDDGAGTPPSAQKRNPVRSILVSAAAKQAPLLGAQLHACAVTVDERPDGAWHAEWSALRDLLRLVGGQVETARAMFDHLRVFPERIEQNLKLSGDGIFAERVQGRLIRELGIFGSGAVIEKWLNKELSLEELIARDPALKSITAKELAALLDPKAATGEASSLIDRAITEARRKLGE